MRLNNLPPRQATPAPVIGRRADCPAFSARLLASLGKATPPPSRRRGKLRTTFSALAFLLLPEGGVPSLCEGEVVGLRLNNFRIPDSGFRSFLFIVILFLSVGCNPADKFSVVPAGMPSMNGLRSLHGKAVVESRAGKDLMLESALLTVKYKDGELGTARLMLPVELPAKEKTAVRYDFALEGLSPANLRILQTRALLNPSALTVDVKGYVRYGKMRKKIDLKNVPMSYIIPIFGTL